MHQKYVEMLKQSQRAQPSILTMILKLRSLETVRYVFDKGVTAQHDVKLILQITAPLMVNLRVAGASADDS